MANAKANENKEMRIVREKVELDLAGLRQELKLLEESLAVEGKDALSDREAAFIGRKVKIAKKSIRRLEKDLDLGMKLWRTRGKNAALWVWRRMLAAAGYLKRLFKVAIMATLAVVIVYALVYVASAIAIIATLIVGLKAIVYAIAGKESPDGWLEKKFEQAGSAISSYVGRKRDASQERLATLKSV